MRTIELVKGIKSSALGFGCAPILGSVGAKKAKRALECALDHGINHFDLARSYGYGEAESFIGKVIKGRRPAVVLASKFGIKANWKAKLLQPAKPLLRYIIQKSRPTVESGQSKIATGSPMIADSMHYRITLNSEEMRKSLEQSLSALKTDYLDYFFIHEPPETIINIDDLQTTAEKMKDEGKIRGWGLAFTWEQNNLHENYLNYFDTLQFNNPVESTQYDEAINRRSLKPNIIFSPLKGGPKKMKPAEKLLTLFNDFPNSVILCSMFSEQHLKENAELI
jgi:aryl-alcohol dehydrogenase-like predicted oxidoreductase